MAGALPKQAVAEGHEVVAAARRSSADLLRGRIPSLDGLRALSILMVVFGHVSATVPGASEQLHELLLMFAGLGVTVFFVLSGFLITALLLKEIQKTGRVSIRAFYVRRAFRIWPAFYVLIVFVALLGLLKAIPLTLGEVISSGLFFWNYYPYNHSWFLGHTWSLSVEEQFYLLWPVLLGWAGPRRGLWIAVTIVAIEPLVRVANYLLAPGMRAYLGMMMHTRADALMIGALAALLYGNVRFESLLKRVLEWKPAVAIAAVVLFVDPFLEQRWRGTYTLSVGFALQNVLIVFLMLWAIRTPGRFWGRLLNSRLAVHIGQISFSLYLWQQIFLTVQNKTLSGVFPLNVAIAVAAAECSFWFVEKPFLRLRKRYVGDA